MTSSKNSDNIIKDLNELIEIAYDNYHTYIDGDDHTNEVIKNLNKSIDKINKTIVVTDITDQQTIDNNRI